MRPGCFRFAFAPFSLQLGRLRKKKVGGGAGEGGGKRVPDKVDTLVGGKLGGEWGESKAKAGACAPLSLTGAKRAKRPDLFSSCKETCFVYFRIGGETKR